MARPVAMRGGSAGGLLMNCLFHKDFETGAEQHWWCGPVSSLQEPCFVPRSADAPEGQGWIVQVCNRLDEARSDLLIFDALDITNGPPMPLYVETMATIIEAPVVSIGAVVMTPALPDCVPATAALARRAGVGAAMV